MHTRTTLLAACAALLLAGCASSGNRCTGSAEYLKAQNLPTPPPVEGIKAAEFGSALRIPPEPASPPATTPAPTSSDSEQACLDLPPRMPAPATSPAAPAPKTS